MIKHVLTRDFYPQLDPANLSICRECNVKLIDTFKFKKTAIKAIEHVSGAGGRRLNVIRNVNSRLNDFNLEDSVVMRIDEFGLAVVHSSRAEELEFYGWTVVLNNTITTTPSKDNENRYDKVDPVKSAQPEEFLHSVEQLPLSPIVAEPSPPRNLPGTNLSIYEDSRATEQAQNRNTPSVSLLKPSEYLQQLKQVDFLQASTKDSSVNKHKRSLKDVFKSIVVDHPESESYAEHSQQSLSSSDTSRKRIRDTDSMIESIKRCKVINGENEIWKCFICNDNKMFSSKFGMRVHFINMHRADTSSQKEQNDDQADENRNKTDKNECQPGTAHCEVQVKPKNIVTTSNAANPMKDKSSVILNRTPGITRDRTMMPNGVTNRKTPHNKFESCRKDEEKNTKTRDLPDKVKSQHREVQNKQKKIVPSSVAKNPMNDISSVIFNRTSCSSNDGTRRRDSVIVMKMPRIKFEISAMISAKDAQVIDSMIVTAEIRKKGAKMYKCPDTNCESMYLTLRSLRLHIQSVHYDYSIDKYVEKLTPAEKKWLDHETDKLLSTKSKQYECVKCRKSNKLRSKMMTHVASMHVNEKPQEKTDDKLRKQNLIEDLQCQEEQTTKPKSKNNPRQSSRLISQEATKPVLQDLFSCQHCSVMFNSPFEIQKHEKVCEGRKIKEIINQSNPIQITD